MPSYITLSQFPLSGVPSQVRIHQPLTAPHPNDCDRCLIPAIDDPKWRRLELAKPRRLELRDDPAAIRGHRQLLNPFDDRSNHPLDGSRLAEPW